jgi:site-specific DNA recombinase
MSNLSAFAKFGKSNQTKTRSVTTKTAVVYTRVSGKEQYDKNLSLDIQRKAIEEYAKRSGIAITEYFGGTYESAKTDGRKEFNRMLDFIKKCNGKVTHILVYMHDRFSRTGGGAIKLAQELREKYGVDIFAVTQPIDTSNPSGIFQQNMQFLFSNYDNEVRKQRAVAGLKEKFNKGIWATKVPMGYDIVKTNGERKIIVNAIGKKLRKAFIWKTGGMKNEQIIERLRAMGVKMYKQQLTKIFANPFYCGLIAHGMLDGKVIEGHHEILISREIFLKVNEIHRQASNYGVPHKKELNTVPLKVFCRCSDCNQPFTGYIVKTKGLWYYKCRTIGCKCNKSAKDFHRLFCDLLGNYTIGEEYKAPLLEEMKSIWQDINKETVELEKSYNNQLIELDRKIENIEESYYVTKEMPKQVFDKYYEKYSRERDIVTQNIASSAGNISNPMEVIEKAIHISTELATTWTSSNIERKEKLQKLLFPEGIVYDKKKGAFRTDRVNTVFQLIARLASVSGNNEKGQTTALTSLSLSAERQGFEPWIPFDRYTHFPGVPLQPLEHLSEGRQK